MKVPYRADIDGLRALAVLAVLFFHSGVSLVPGGYVGVDVFFVISGFLITSILRREVEDGTYSIAAFYERRIRRIIPALLVVSVVTILLAGFILLPSMNRTVPKQALSALGFVANLYFWRTADYFAPNAETMPFLHTWSLGVEEQFYIFMPLAMVVVCRWRRQWQLAALLAAVAVSFALSVGLTPSRPVPSFYLLPTRAWELLAGALLTYVPRGGARPRGRDEVLAAAGLAMLAAAVFLFDSATPFPGYAAALPVLGAVLLIHFAPGTRVGALLSVRPLVGVGLISYSLYLWHWPIVVFARSERFTLDPAVEPLLIIGLSLVLAVLSWRYVEQPFRNRAVLPPRRMLGLVAAGCVAVFATGWLLKASGGHFTAMDARALAFDRARFDISPWRLACHLSAGVTRPGGYCELGDGSKGELTVWADSHGVELSAALAQLGYKVTTITYSACLPSPDYVSVTRPHCQAHNASVLAQLTAGDAPRRIVLAANLAGYPEEVVPGIVKAANALAAAGHDVMLIGPMPTPKLDVPTHLAYGHDPDFQPETDRVYALLSGLDPRVRVIDPTGIFCRDDRCSMLVDGAPLLFDAGHPSLTAARHIAAALPPSALARQD